MTNAEYLERIFKKHDSGKIDDDEYDRLIHNFLTLSEPKDRYLMPENRQFFLDEYSKTIEEYERFVIKKKLLSEFLWGEEI